MVLSFKYLNVSRKERRPKIINELEDNSACKKIKTIA